MGKSNRFGPALPDSEIDLPFAIFVSAVRVFRDLRAKTCSVRNRESDRASRELHKSRKDQIERLHPEDRWPTRRCDVTADYE